MEVSAPDDGLWMLLSKECVALGHGIVFDSKGAVLWDGHIAGMGPALAKQGAVKDVGAVWLNPQDATLFAEWSTRLGHPPGEGPVKRPRKPKHLPKVTLAHIRAAGGAVLHDRNANRYATPAGRALRSRSIEGLIARGMLKANEDGLFPGMSQSYSLREPA